MTDSSKTRRSTMDTPQTTLDLSKSKGDTEQENENVNEYSYQASKMPFEEKSVELSSDASGINKSSTSELTNTQQKDETSDQMNKSDIQNEIKTSVLTKEQPAIQSEETKEHSYQSSELQHCGPCLNKGVDIGAVKFCEDCDDYLCNPCEEYHKILKSTKNHKMSEVKEVYKAFFHHTCDPCTYLSVNANGLYFCTTCEEYLCDACKEVHLQFKATRGHAIVPIVESPLYKSETILECGVCEEPIHQKAVAFCIECVPNELFCSDCLIHHQSVKMTRNHTLNYHLEQYKNRSTENNREFNSTRSIGIKLKEQNPLKPGKPGLCVDPKADSVQLIWNQPQAFYRAYQYQIRFRSPPSDKWTFYDKQFTENVAVLNNLKSDTAFIFEVRMINNDCEGPYSDQSDLISTKQSAANLLIGFSKIVLNDEEGVMTKRKLLLEEIKMARNENSKTRKFYLGDPRPLNNREKTVLLVGATGSGKSTLVDGFINYILGVNWGDPFRFTIVDLEEEEKGIHNNQAVSQTKWITTYCINPVDGSRLDYKLNIIDTPGFGDTKGFERDKEIVDQIRQLFSASDDSGVVFIDAVCFLTKAPDARLTPTQRYIFNAILSLFGQDIASNITIVVTFADGKTPPVVHALKEANLPHDVFFPFNNSGLFADNSGPSMSSLSPMFWEMGRHSFNAFFEHLASLQTRSLNQTKEVLMQRNSLEITIENLSPMVSNGLNTLDEMREEIIILEQHKTEIEANKEFEYVVTETKQIKIDLPSGQHVTNCLNCHVTCHKKCKIPNDEDKHRCWAMDDGYCTQCLENCHWKQHANTPYIFDYVQEKKTKTYTEKLEKYRNASDEKMTHEKVIFRMLDELEAVEKDIYQCMEDINECNNILREIALRPNPLSITEHIDILIEAEKHDKRVGFQKRILVLMEFRKKCTIADDVDRFRKDLIDTRNHSTFCARKKEGRQGKSIFNKMTKYVWRK